MQVRMEQEEGHRRGCLPIFFPRRCTYPRDSPHNHFYVHTLLCRKEQSILRSIFKKKYIVPRKTGRNEGTQWLHQHQSKSWFEHSQRLPITSSTMHMEITGNPKNQDKFKQRKLKPSVSFPIQQSMKFLLPAIKRAENQSKKKESCRTLSSTLFVLWRCFMPVRITNNISLFCHLFPAPTSAWHQSRGALTTAEHQQSFLTWWFVEEGYGLSLSYKERKCLRPLFHFYDTLSAEKMPIQKLPVDIS